MNYSWERIVKSDGTLDIDQLKENFKQIENDKRNSPYLYGKGTPFSNNTALIGSVYVDTTNGNVYKRKDTGSLNNGWVKLVSSGCQSWIKPAVGSGTANIGTIFNGKYGTLNFDKYTQSSDKGLSYSNGVVTLKNNTRYRLSSNQHFIGNGVADAYLLTFWMGAKNNIQFSLPDSIMWSAAATRPIGDSGYDKNELIYDTPSDGVIEVGIGLYSASNVARLYEGWSGLAVTYMLVEEIGSL